MILSLSWFAAWYHQQQGVALAAAWTGQAWQGTEQQWTDAFTAADRAGLINPFDRKTPLLQADLYFSKAQAQRLYRSEAERNRGLGLEKIRSALRASPASALLWARLAMAKVQAGELDAEFDAAVGHALARGAWDPDMQFYLFYAGMGGWQALSEDHKALFLNTLSDVLPVARKDIFDHVFRTAVAAGWAPQLRELLLDKHPKLSRHLERIVAQRRR